MFDLTHPEHVGDDEWEGLSQLRDRLERALRSGDHPLAVGTAKELCEAVAKLTWLRRGEQFASRTDMSQLVAQAHKLVGRLPGESGAMANEAREIAQTAMRLVSNLVELRDRAGTGHGRPERSSLDAHDAEFAAGVALLWSSWMLGRLDALVANSPETRRGPQAPDLLPRRDRASTASSGPCDAGGDGPTPDRHRSRPARGRWHLPHA